MARSCRFKVLFVCLGNACRSPMGEAIAAKLAADVIEAASAGLTPLGHVEPLTLETLTRNGYPIGGLESKELDVAALEAADLVINMSGRPKEQEFENPGKVEDWRVQDPYGADAELYQRIFEDIERRVAELADRLRSQQGTTIRGGNNKGQDQR